MSKVKQWAENEAEKAVDKILLQVKQNLITVETAKTDIMNVANVDLTGIDEHNVEKVNVVQKTKKTPGIITKIMSTKCLVDLNGRIYRVSMSMLEAA